MALNSDTIISYEWDYMWMFFPFLRLCSQLQYRDNNTHLSDFNEEVICRKYYITVIWKCQVNIQLIIIECIYAPNNRISAQPICIRWWKPHLPTTSQTWHKWNFSGYASFLFKWLEQPEINCLRPNPDVWITN